MYIIAEIGINHNGSLDNALKLVDIANNAGCDAVKFQKRTIDIVYSKEELAKHRESPWGSTTEMQKKGLEFSIKDYEKIYQYCNDKKIDFFFSCWDLNSFEEVQKFNCPHNKIASAMITHIDFLNRVAEVGVHTFISTGMSDMKNIENAVKIFREKNCDFTLMHTNSTYPTKDIECNIKMINTLKKTFDCDVGYSGHEVGLLPSIMAATLGARFIERHITIDRSMYGSDQSASLEKKGLETLVRDLKAIDGILGNGIKSISEEEMKVASKLRYFEN
tara:strand:- start:24257 stop:25084 length:828 start_codon:yes stop_codon:yes gene_type:complete